MSLFLSILGQSRMRLAQVGLALAGVAVIAGCGSSYRPVITPLDPSGPPAQPNGYAVVVSSPSSTAAGVATVIDYSGDTLMVQAAIGPNPFAFSLDSTGLFVFSVFCVGTLTNFLVLLV